MKYVEIDGVGMVAIVKSRRAKRVICAIKSDGKPRVTIPYHLPFLIGKQYALQNRQWFLAHTTNNSEQLLKEGQAIGKTHRVSFKTGEKIGSRVGNNTVSITHPSNIAASSTKVQAEALKAATRAIRRQAEQILPKRLYHLASLYNYSFMEVRCKNLRTRWGSCSSEGIINLNIWLMQLPDSLIDYVLVHELAHLNHPHHQVTFWQEVQSIIPEYKELRKSLKQYNPRLTIQP